MFTAFALSLSLCGCGSDNESDSPGIYIHSNIKQNSEQNTYEEHDSYELQSSIANVENDYADDELEEKPSEQKKEDDMIEVVKEYTYKSIFLYTYHFVIVKNVSDVPLSISTSTIAYGKNDDIISVASGDVDI